MASSDLRSVMSIVLLLVAGFLLIPQASLAKSAEEKRDAAEIPRCSESLGNLAVGESETFWWRDLGLGNPEALIRVFVQQSKCFKLVNRSARGMEAMSRERDLQASGELRRGGTVGKGQMLQADFTVIPDIVSANESRGGNAIGGALGGFFGGGAGAALGGINVKKKSADVVLNLLNNQTSEEYVIEGRAKKSDLKWGGGGGLFAGGIFAAAGATGYENTEIGQVIALAYLDAYTKMVTDLGGLQDFTTSDVAERAVRMKRPGRLFEAPDLGAKVRKEVGQGAILYPTGKKEAGFWEVEDELGAVGWVPEASLELAK